MTWIRAACLVFLVGAIFVQPARAQSAEEAIRSGTDEVSAAYQAGNYVRALGLAKSVLAQAEAELGPEHPSTLTSVNILAFLHNATGSYGEAERLYVRALESRERVLGAEHPNTLTSVNNLATLYDITGRYGEAEPLYERALESRERVLGPEHPNTLISANNLAFLYRVTGRYGEAEQLFLRAFIVSERVLGPEHPNTLVTGNNLAFIYEITGRYGDAEPLYLRALENFERTLGSEHPDTLISVNNLAKFYQSAGRYGEAEPLFLRALESQERVLGPEHPDTLGSLHNLAFLYQRTGRSSGAERLFLRALESQERVLGPEHPDTLGSLNNLALLYLAIGRYGEAEPLFLRALESFERVLGPGHPDTMNSQGNLALFYASSKRPKQALRVLRQLDLNLDRWLRTEVSTAQAASMQRQMLRLHDGYQDGSLSLILDHPDRASVSFAADLLLRWKKRIAQDDAVLNNITRESDDSDLVALVDAVKEGRRALSNAAFDPGVPADEKERLRQVLEAKETALRSASEEYRRFQTVSQARASDIELILKPGEVLIEYKFFSPFDYETTEYAARRLLAVILRSYADPVIVDLGGAEIFSSMQALTVSSDLRNENKIPFDAVMSAAFTRLIAPLEPHLQDAETLYISPDGVLGALPFEAFVTETGLRLIERYQIRTLQTGRDLVARDRPISGKGLVAVGAVDFGPAPQRETEEHAALDETGHALIEATRQQFTSFKQLPETGPEIDHIASAYSAGRPDEPAPQLLKGAEATEAAIKGLTQSPRVLHFATHGYYLESGSFEGRPLLQSGITLAGANMALAGQFGADQENGILHAVEVQTLNLFGTELVVLSACDTGQGVVDYSEGLEGLPRAFYVAGAKNVLAALWPVGDTAARKFMARFYDLWLETLNGNPADALRATKLWYVQNTNPDIANPENWAQFVLIEG